MEKETRERVGGAENKAYVEPTLEKAQKIEDITEGAAPPVIVT